ncbi:MAG: fumarylacetoacetate hydrolase family protein [Pseudomonadota bacterium]
MGISVVRFCSEDQEGSWGLLRDGLVYALRLSAKSHKELLHFHRDDAQAIERSAGEVVGAVSELNLLSPVSGDVQLFCQGLNYSDHRAEGGMDEGSAEDENLIFSKASSSICGPHDDIVRPSGCVLLDYEIELGIVLTTDVTKPTLISESELREYVGAILIANDVSARDISFGSPAMQWYQGKSHRTFCPLGPVLYLLAEDDFGQLDALELHLSVNGVTKQRATTDLLIHKPAKTIADVSNFADIYTGDCILTGTPGGVQLQMNARTGLSILMNMRNDKKRREKFVAAQLANNTYLRPGDQLELSIKSIDGSIDLGVQSNKVVDAIE